MNATKYEKIYSVVAEYYNGDTLVETKTVETIKMAPGTDHVATGIVKVGEGQTVKVYTLDQSLPELDEGAAVPGATEPLAGDQANADKAKKQEETTLLIVVIITAVILVAVVVVGLILVTKKKPTPAEEEESEKTEETNETESEQ